MIDGYIYETHHSFNYSKKLFGDVLTKYLADVMSLQISFESVYACRFHKIRFVDF